MVVNVERIIQYIKHGDQDNVQIQLEVYNSEVYTALMWFIRTKLQPQVLRACLRTLRILSRDRLALAPLETDDALMTFAHLGGLTSLPMTSDASEGQEYGDSVIIVLALKHEIIKITFGTFFFRLLSGLSERLKKELDSPLPPAGQFYELRLLFLLTALRPELRLQLQQERGVSLLTSALEQCLSVKWMDVNEVQSDPTAPPVRKEVSEKAVEILKTLFNVTHDAHRNEPDEVQCALYRRLAAVLRHCMLLESKATRSTQSEKHAVNLLSALPLQCLDVLLSGRLSTSSVEWEGLNMDCVRSLLQFLERRLDAGHKLKEKLTPVLNLLTESSKVHRGTRHYLKQQILPPLRDLSLRPEQGTSVRSRLVRLMTHVDTDIKHCAAELLFVLCKENAVRRFVKYTGYGNAAGLLAARGLLSGCGPYHQSQYSSDSDSDSDTEEYRHAKGRINPVTGRVEEEQPDPMEGMTEEEKEAEARKLIWMFNRLSRCVCPVSRTTLQPQGQSVPIKTNWFMSEDSEEDLDE
uniref:Synembryn n=1 Tax=Denticeps clupeoides TaxID=299321 RepID=A0AAY4CLT6_9TELE